MGALSHVIWSLPLLGDHVEALTSTLVNYCKPLMTRRGGGGIRLGMPIGEWCCWQALSLAPIPSTFPMEPWAIPNPWRAYGIWEPTPDGFAYPEGLYWVSDRMPVIASTYPGAAPSNGLLGYVVVIIPTGSASAGASITLTMDDASTVDIPIPEDYVLRLAGTGQGAFAVPVDSTSGITTAPTIAGATFSLYEILPPPGALVKPGDWLAGYEAPAIEPPAAPVPWFSGSAVGCTNGTVPMNGEGGTRMDGCSGYAALPRLAYASSMPHAFCPPFVVDSDGVLWEQNCGPSSVIESDLMELAAGIPAYCSSPRGALYRIDWPIGGIGGSSSVTVTITEKTPAGAVVATYSESFTPPSGYSQTFRAMPATLRPFNLFYLTSCSPDLGASLGIRIVPSWQHPLPFSVAASDLTVIPGGVASVYLRTPSTDAAELSTGTVGTTTKGASPRAWEVGWTGLTPGLYLLSQAASTWGYWLEDDGGGCVRGASGASRRVLSRGSLTMRALNVYAGSQSVLAVESVTPTTISLGDTAIAAGNGYRWFQFTAGSAGRYSCGLSGGVSVHAALVVSASDPYCMTGVIARARTYTRRVRTIYAKQNDPPAVPDSNLGWREYLVGDTPTGAWSGLAGRVVGAMMGPRSYTWEQQITCRGDVAQIGSTWYLHPDDGDGLVQVTGSSRQFCSVSVSLAASQTVYIRIGRTLANVSPSDYFTASRESEHDLPWEAASDGASSLNSGALTITAM